MQLPENMQSDASMRGGHSLVDLSKHGLPGVKLNIL